MSCVGKLLEEIDLLFVKKKNIFGPTCVAFSLARDEKGYWSIEVTDDWHKWSEKGLLHKDEMNSRYITAEAACEAFLKFVKDNKIKVSKLQSKY